MIASLKERKRNESTFPKECLAKSEIKISFPDPETCKNRLLNNPTDFQVRNQLEIHKICDEYF